MLRLGFVLVACAAVAAGCTNTPTGPDGARPARLSRTRFLAFGDSITAGEVVAPVNRLGSPAVAQKLQLMPAASYPARLQSMLESRYSAQAASISVVNGGTPGEKIFEGAARLQDLLTMHHPEVVLLMEGANGIDYIGPDTSTGIMRTMVQASRSHKAAVFVGSMIPTVPGRPRSQIPGHLVSYNTTLQLMSQQEGVVYVDVYNTLLPEAASVIGADGLHPTEAGHKRIADVFFNAIRAHLEVTPR